MREIPRHWIREDDPTGVAALYLGKREGKELVYMGKVGTSWSRTVSGQIRKQLDTVGEFEVQAHQANPQTKSDVGRAFLCR